MLLDMGFDASLVTWAFAARGAGSVREALHLLCPDSDRKGANGEVSLPAQPIVQHNVDIRWWREEPYSLPAGAGGEAQYVRRAREEFGIHVEVVDLGITAGPAPRTNACLWLSVVAAASRVLNDSTPSLATPLWDVIKGCLAAIANISAHQLGENARIHPRTDAVGRAADVLRQYACDEMINEHGRLQFKAWFAALVGSAPGSAGVTMVDYERHVADLRKDKFADQLNLWQLATILGLRIVVLPYTPSTSIHIVWASQDMNPQGVEAARTIYVGNNDRHYVWLHPVDAGGPARQARGRP
jgi:hypothetical protein